MTFISAIPQTAIDPTLPVAYDSLASLDTSLTARNNFGVSFLNKSQVKNTFTLVHSSDVSQFRRCVFFPLCEKWLKWE